MSKPTTMQAQPAEITKTCKHPLSQLTPIAGTISATCSCGATGRMPQEVLKELRRI